MPPQLALLICILGILYLFWVDRKKNEGISRAILIPLIWMLPSASREFSFWLRYLFNIGSSSGSIIEGNPYDRGIQTVLMVAGLIVLMKRRPNWNALFTKNRWIWLYFIFGAISFLWSDYPLVSLKRWFKALGNVIMVVVILTEDRPYEAIGVILRRLAFLLLPLSVLLIKYYPELGKTYHRGLPMYMGVADQKNGLGQICLFCGIYFCWKLLLNRREGIELGRRLHFSIYLIILPMLAWLFHMANSATSLACMIVAVGLFVVARQPVVAREPSRVLVFCIACIVLFGIMEYFFDVLNTIITMLGRRQDLTTRVPMWNDLLGMVKNPIVGFGYESFWLGDRWQYMYEKWKITSQAHNGYLEMYLNMGLIGLFFLLCWILSGLRKVNRHLAIDYKAAMLRLCFIVIVVLYNWTEATFYGNTTMWLLFLVGVMDMQGQISTSPPASTEYGEKPG
jgi:O-antigen ligase